MGWEGGGLTALHTVSRKNTNIPDCSDILALIFNRCWGEPEQIIENCFNLLEPAYCIIQVLLSQETSWTNVTKEQTIPHDDVTKM